MSYLNKRRRAKHFGLQSVNIPVMTELQDVFALDAHGAFASLCARPNQGAFNQLANLFNMIQVGLRDIGQQSVILDSGMRTLQEVGMRAEQAGHLAVARHQIPPIRNAVIECETLVRKLDVIGLYIAGEKLIKNAAIGKTLFK